MRTTRFSSFSLPLSLIAAASLGLVGCDLLPAPPDGIGLPEAPEEDFLSDDEGSLAGFLADEDNDGFAPDDGDCDDANPMVFPGAPEACDGIDANCDGLLNDPAVCAEDGIGGGFGPGLEGDDDDDDDDDDAADDDDDDDDADSVASGARFAVLTDFDGTGYDIRILDSDGDLMQHIDANLQGVQYLDYHRDGFFLASGGSVILRVETDGTHSVLFDGCDDASGICLSPIYQVDEKLNGNIIVAAEGLAAELDLDGNIVATTSGSCFTDVIAKPAGSSDAALLDIMAPNVVHWDGSAATDLVAEITWDHRALGQDLSGTYWVAGWGSTVNRIVDGEEQVVGNLSDIVPDVWEVVSFSTAGETSVFALVQGDEGSSIVRMGADASSETLIEGGWEYWTDMVVL